MSAANPQVRTVSIRPGVSILSVLRHLNYKPWFALAEFVDNAIQSFASMKGELLALNGGARLEVGIEVTSGDGQTITIRDNAAGIADTEFERAFQPAAIPLDRSGLCEFGMGMKSAACWFASDWVVRTSALGEPFVKEIKFDIRSIVDGAIENLTVNHSPAPANDHYTEITLLNLHRPLAGRTLGKVREHLASIYREFIRSETLVLRVGAFNDPPLEYGDSAILVAPYFRDDNGESLEWRKDIDFDFGLDMRCTGFAALRAKASTSDAGFALFRRGRLIQGSADEGYRPETVFRKSNSFTYQRLFGELHLDGFEVSHTKDGFRWEDNEETFLELLRDHLDADPLPILRQAEGYRAKPKPEDVLPGATKAAQNTGAALERGAATEIDGQLHVPPPTEPLPESLDDATPATNATFRIELLSAVWYVELELTTDPSVAEWLTIGSSENQGGEDGKDVSKLQVRLSLSHRFMERFSGADAREIEPILRVAAALALAETTAVRAGVRGATAIRRYVNDYLRGSLANP